MKEKDKKSINIDLDLWKELQRAKADTGKGLNILMAEAWKSYSSAVPAPDSPPLPRKSSYAPENQKLHDMLEEVLNSGDEPTIRAVVPNIEIFHARLQPRPMHGRRKAG